MKAYTFDDGRLEFGISITEKTNNANLGEFQARGQLVDFSIFYTERKVPDSTTNDFAIGFNLTPLLTVVNRYVASEGVAFCLIKHAFQNQLCYCVKAYVLAASSDNDAEADLSLIRIDEGGYIELCEKITDEGDMRPVWRIYNSTGVLSCQRLHWDAPWSVDGKHLFARLDATSMVRIALDFVNHNTIESKLELLTDRGWVGIAERHVDPDFDFLRGAGSDDHRISLSRVAARCNLSRDLAQHAAFLYQGRLSDPSLPFSYAERC